VSSSAGNGGVVPTTRDLRQTIEAVLWRCGERTWSLAAGLLAFQAPLILLFGKFGLLAALVGICLGLLIAFLPIYLIAVVLDLSRRGAQSLRDRASIAYPVLVVGGVESIVIGVGTGRL
jgi:hypothetical protein